LSAETGQRLLQKLRIGERLSDYADANNNTSGTGWEREAEIEPPRFDIAFWIQRKNGRFKMMVKPKHFNPSL
jgi:hypothetical protein